MKNVSAYGSFDDYRCVQRMWPQQDDSGDIRSRYLAVRRWTRNSSVRCVISCCAKRCSVTADIAIARIALRIWLRTQRVPRVREKVSRNNRRRTCRSFSDSCLNSTRSLWSYEFIRRQTLFTIIWNGRYNKVTDWLIDRLLFYFYHFIWRIQ